MREIGRLKGSIAIVLAVFIHVSLIYAVFEISYKSLTITLFWSILYSFNFLGMVVAVFHKSPKLNRVAKGRVIAIVPTFNDTPGAIKRTIRSLLKQSILIHEIHVIDDCSDVPMKAYVHDRVFCHWHKENKGKREAQATVLKSLNPKEVDFILTVDADSILDRRAAEYMLRAMNDKKVAAVSGTVLLKNRNYNLLTRAQECQYGLAFLIGRTTRRAFRVLETTSGACSLYRGATFYFHLEDYLENGQHQPCGDDRRLCIYALMEGDVLYVPEAVVYTDAPTGLKQLWRQSVRWGKSTWTAFPFHMANLGFRKNFFVCYTYLSTLLFPFMTVATVISVIAGFPGIVISIFLFHLLDTYTRALVFALARKGSFFERWLTWLFVTPLMVAIIYFITLPARQYALFNLRDRSWGTRAKAEQN